MLVVFAWKPQERGSGRRSNPLRIQPGNGQRFCLMSFCIKERLEEAKAPLESGLVVHNVSWDFVSGFGYAMTCSDIWIIDTLYIPDVQQICGRNMLETAEMLGSGHPLDCSGGKLCEAWMFGGWGWGKPNPNKVRFLPFIMPWKYGWKMACRNVFTFSRVLFFEKTFKSCFKIASQQHPDDFIWMWYTSKMTDGKSSLLTSWKGQDSCGVFFSIQAKDFSWVRIC